MMGVREVDVGGRLVGDASPTYFVADIAANHDGDLGRARELIHLAAAAGADAAKFQHFTADTIVSDRGFKSLGARQSHQAGWGKSVYEVYSDASLDLGWTPVLKEACDEAGIDFFTAPYSLELVDAVNPYVAAFKVGSGDITWLEIITHMARKGKAVMLATGASSLDEVCAAADTVLAETDQLVLMQCNTNYTGTLENLRYVNLAVLRTYRQLYPDVVLGLSDHTPGHVAVLGAVALGARVIEKHFTDDSSRSGPDHAFSLEPTSWREMVDRTRDLEGALGSPVKRVEANERETVVLQRRCLRAARYLDSGTLLARQHLAPLRPCPPDGIPPSAMDEVVGAKLRRALEPGEHVRRNDLE
jgi:N-acetylneuraminate synthase